MTPRTFLTVLVVLSACTPSSDQTSSSDPGQVEEAAVMGPTVSVEEIADDVYRFSYNNHRSLFIATTEGVLVTDPQSPEAAERYLEEIRKITDAPIRYLVYSHYHNDHASGGAVFGDDVVTISHENVLAHLEDEGMTAVRPPDETFVDEMSLTIGDIDVNLSFPGHSETDSNIILHVPSRRLVFIVDTLSVRSLPWRNLASGDLAGWTAALETLSQYDVDQFVPGHGEIGTHNDVREHLEYFETLTREVTDRMDDGQSLEAIQASLELPQYATWGGYDEHFALNIEGIYRELAEQRQ